MTRLHPAIRTTYRISLRSSSLREPRYPLLRVLVILEIEAGFRRRFRPDYGFSIVFGVCVCVLRTRPPQESDSSGAPSLPLPPKGERQRRGEKRSKFAERIDHSNDPSAGSPTETLLRLLLPLGGRVYRSSRRKPAETANDRQSQRFTSTPNR